MSNKKTLADLRVHHEVVPFTAKRLMQVVEKIEAHPERYYQDEFGSAENGTFDFEQHEVKCNTACCIAGHIVVMFADTRTPRNISSSEVPDEAVRLLIEDENDEVWTYCRISRLFDPAEEWPPQFKGAKDEVTPECVRRRVEHYIETGSML